MNSIMTETIILIVISIISLTAFSYFIFVFGRKVILDENKSLLKENEELKAKNADYLEKGKQLFAQNKRLEEWKKYLNADAKAQEIVLKAKEILADANEKAQEIESDARRKLELANENARVIKESSESQINEKLRHKMEELDSITMKVEEAYKTFKYRKNLPEQHDKLKERFDELKEKHDQLQAEFKSLKSENKGQKLNDAERQKFLAQFEKLGRSYVDDNFKFIVSKMTTSNFAASRDRMLKAINTCRSLGFDWPDNMEDDYTEKIREEFKRILRIDDMRQEQQRIKEQIREEQKASRELEKLKKKEEEAIKEREQAERAKEELQRAIADALDKANGEYTSQILEMQKTLSEKEQEIAAKQQEIDDNQRAISNAQITKAGHVYVLSNIGSFGDGVFKIGMTRRSDPQERVDELGSASVPFPFDVHLMIGCDNAPELEKRLHQKFNHARINRVNLRKEHFRVSVDEVRQEIIDFLGKDVDYVADPHVMEEYAEQYRQSQETSLADIEEVEQLFEEAGVDTDE